jgi:DNA-binding Lrp family transcriptional regulator
MTPRRLDELDRAIISQLQEDGRKPFRAIARSLGVAEGTVRFRATRMQEEGALHILALADPFALGYAVQASVLVRVTPTAHGDVAETLAAWPEVMCRATGGGQRCGRHRDADGASRPQGPLRLPRTDRCAALRC